MTTQNRKRPCDQVNDLARSCTPAYTHRFWKGSKTVAIEPSRQFRSKAIDDHLKLAQIEKLESDSAKSRQEVMVSLQKMFGPKS